MLLIESGEKGGAGRDITRDQMRRVISTIQQQRVMGGSAASGGRRRAGAVHSWGVLGSDEQMFARRSARSRYWNKWGFLDAGFSYFVDSSLSGGDLSVAALLSASLVL